jgi:aminoacrylate hydrolase
MPKAQFEDFELYYETHGEGEPVLLVAGLGGVGGYWQPQMKPFSEKYQVIVHDHRGTGQSSHSRIQYSIEQMADDVVRLMDKLNIERAHLVGHSTGGVIGQVMAIEHPDRLKSVVAYASWTKADPFMRRVFEARRTLLTSSGARAYVRSTPVFLYPDWWINQNEALLAEREARSIPAAAAPEIGAKRIDALMAFDRTAELHKIKTPTLVVCAKDDLLTPAYFSVELAKSIKEAELVLLERGGHACSETAPEEFNKVVLDFLARHG